MTIERAAAVHAEPAVGLRVAGERPLFLLAVYLMLGIASAALLPAPPSVCPLVLMALLLLGAILFALKVDITVVLVLIAFASGYALLSAALPPWAADPSAPAGEVEVTGRIEAVGLTRGGYTQYTIGGVRVGGSAIDGRVLVTAQGGAQGREGDALTAYAELERPEPSAYYGGFNARGYYLRRGIRFTAFAAEPKIVPSGQEETLWDLPRRARSYATDLLNRHLSPDAAAVVDALLSGNRSGISEGIGDSFVDLGVAHLLAVSGLNISLTAGAAWLLCRKLRLPMPVSLFVSFLVMAAYVLFAGLTPSVMRAAAMWCVMMGGLVAARRYDPLSSIAAAAVLILALNPLDLFDAGFQLSFAATAAMFLWLAPLSRHMPENKLVRAFASSVGVTLCVTLLALPLILGCFNGVSLMSPLANLLLVPFSLALQLAGTALLFLGLLPGAASLLGPMIDGFASFYLHNVKLLDWAASHLPAAAPPLWLAAGYAALAAAVSPSLVRMRPRLRACAWAALAACALVMLSPLSPALSGHGDAAIVAEGKSSLSLYWEVNGRRYAACADRLTELSGYLRSRGVARLDGLYVLDDKPPKDGAMLAEGGGIEADALYVPDGWLQDPAAQPFLEKGLALGMAPLAASGGPFDYGGGESSAVLLLPAGGGRLAFVPWLPKGAAASLTGAVAAADIAVVNAAADKAEDIVNAPHHALVLRGAVADRARGIYNGTACGSMEVADAGGKPALMPWRNGWENGLQGNFR